MTILKGNDITPEVKQGIINYLDVFYLNGVEDILWINTKENEMDLIFMDKLDSGENLFIFCSFFQLNTDDPDFEYRLVEIEEAKKIYNQDAEVIESITTLKEDKAEIIQYIKMNTDSLYESLEESLSEYKKDIIEYDEATERWILYSGDRTKILGRFKTEAQAKRREKQIILFKNMTKNPELKAKITRAIKRKNATDNDPIPALNSDQMIKIDKMLESLSDVDSDSINASLLSLLGDG